MPGPGHDPNTAVLGMTHLPTFTGAVSQNLGVGIRASTSSRWRGPIGVTFRSHGLVCPRVKIGRLVTEVLPNAVMHRYLGCITWV